ncbi:hypothetical protein G9394_14105 [Proteus vulgaris]|nr:hypothetical protein G9394_14105 [Proteus vulgaris]
MNKDSKYKPAIYTDFSTILTCMPEINLRLNRKVRISVANEKIYGTYKYSPKVLLFFLLYVIASLYPVKTDDIYLLTNEIINYKGRESKNNINFMLSLGVALGLFRKSQRNSYIYYSCVDFDKFFNHESTKNILKNILKSRARALSDLIRIPAFKEELSQVMKNVN